MSPRKFDRGVTLIEMIMAMSIAVIAMMIMWKGVRYLQSTLGQQMRLERMSQILTMTQEIARNIRSARRILSVGPGHLDLEVYNHAAHGLFDAALYDQLRRVRYEARGQENSWALVRDIYTSTSAVKPETTSVALKHVDLLAPQPAVPFFFASYLVGDSTVGVRVALALHPPYSQDTWVPIKEEVYVKAE